jgi:hypothetical protein
MKTTYVPVLFSPAKINATHLWDINAKLGVRFSAGALRPIYENLLAARGVTEANGAPVVLPAVTPAIVPVGDPFE